MTYIPALEEKIQYLAMLGENVPIPSLLNMLAAALPDIQRNAARTLLSLYKYVPAESIIIWMQRVDFESEIHSFYTRKVLAEAYIYLGRADRMLHP